MEFGVLLIKSHLGDGKFNKTNSIWVPCFMGIKKIKKNPKGCLVMYFGHYERRKSKDLLKAKKMSN